MDINLIKTPKVENILHIVLSAITFTFKCLFNIIQHSFWLRFQMVSRNHVYFCFLCKRVHRFYHRAFHIRTSSGTNIKYVVLLRSKILKPFICSARISEYLTLIQTSSKDESTKNDNFELQASTNTHFSEREQVSIERFEVRHNTIFYVLTEILPQGETITTQHADVDVRLSDRLANLASKESKIRKGMYF